ncbi:MAG TPA: hypothetical protein VM115_00715 [Vicinamibacterales bacterium]|nr:hypothetical protein [Vicinamibacterales bacterium]
MIRAIRDYYSIREVTDRFPKLLSAIGLLIGAAAAVFYYQRGLTLSHYDAKAHLVVARRVLDSLTPEYSQIGAVWLPLPHLLNLLPVQIDWLYRTGLSGVAISVLSFALACYAIARLVLRVTRSRGAAAISVAMFALDPDVLYLQSTPMTEPLLFGLVLLSICLVYDWVGTTPVTTPATAPFATAPSAAGPVAQDFSPAKAGWCLVLACLTRYEAWMVTAAVLVLATVALWRRGFSLIAALKAVAHLGVYPVLAIVAFFVHSWFTTGAWFVTGGFYVPDNLATGSVYGSIMTVVYGMRTLIGTPFVLLAVAGAVAVLARGVSRVEHAASLVVLALIALIALPAYAFFNGHPFRMRYMVAPSVGAAVFAGVALGMLKGYARHAAIAVTAVWLVVTAKPIDAQAPMVQEAQWDVPFSVGRRNVTACLAREYHGERILASMGSLAHYMQELSHAGIDIRDFVHEGTLPYWQEAIEAPQGRVGWILVEERAEGGDVLAARARASSAFTSGFVRVCADGGVALYKAEAKN